MQELNRRPLRRFIEGRGRTEMLDLLKKQGFDFKTSKEPPGTISRDGAHYNAQRCIETIAMMALYGVKPAQEGLVKRQDRKSPLENAVAVFAQNPLRAIAAHREMMLVHNHADRMLEGSRESTRDRITSNFILGAGAVAIASSVIPSFVAAATVIGFGGLKMTERTAEILAERNSDIHYHQKLARQSIQKIFTPS